MIVHDFVTFPTVLCLSLSLGGLACAEQKSLPKPSRTIEIESGRVLPSPDGTTGAVSLFDARPYIVDAASGKTTTRLALPSGFQADVMAFSPDSSKVAGIGASKDDKDFILVWNASSGKLLHRAAVPDSAVYVMSVSFSRKGDVVYVGARHELYRYDLRTSRLTTLIPNVPYYVVDILERPDGRVLGYVEPYSSYGLHRWSQKKGSELPLLFKKERKEADQLGIVIQCFSADYSSDETEIAVLIYAAGPKGEHWSKVARLDAATGKIRSSAIVREQLKRVRYVGDTKVLFVWGWPDGDFPDRGGFGFIPAEPMQIAGWVEAESPINGASADPGEKGHVTVGLTDGTLFQWRRQDWPEEWKSLFEH